MKATERLWRTADGRLVADGDEAGKSLAYAPGDDISEADVERVALQQAEPDDQQQGDEHQQRPGAKRARRPADKSRRPAADKTGE
ncbi:hypothetical protein ACFYOK_29425 [Microbispora bryophytorum]|uniref:hypothetical protein n=1 Tax=Microbispora bryophytorum TaxID=1460882 RepID=UPI0033D6CD47